MKTVKVPPDIGNYQERIFLNLTGRQALAIAVGAVAVWLIYGQLPFSKDVKDTLLMVAVPCCFALGWIKLQGLPLERWVPILLSYLIWPQQRPWKPEEEEG